MRFGQALASRVHTELGTVLWMGDINMVPEGSMSIRLRAYPRLTLLYNIVQSIIITIIYIVLTPTRALLLTTGYAKPHEPSAPTAP